MQGDSDVIEILNEVLTAELTAVNQYFVHAKMCANWGYAKLAAHIQAESIDEMRHAELAIDRILFLDGVPNMQRYFALQVGETVKEQLQNDLEVERSAIDRFNRGIALCVERKDNATREMLEQMLVSENGHVDWLEAQLTLIEQVGEQNYLATQIA